MPNKKKRRQGKRELSMALRRQWAIGIMIQSHAWSVAGLARAFGVSKATIQRDIDLLRGLFKISVLDDPQHSQRVRYRMRGRFVSIV